MFIAALVFTLIAMAYALGHQDGAMEKEELHQWARFDQLLEELRTRKVSKR